MSDFIIGEVVKLKSGGHEMTVRSIDSDASIGCIWSDGKRIRSESFNPGLLSKGGLPTGIEVRIVHSDCDIDELVNELRNASERKDHSGFYIANDQAKNILKNYLGPGNASRASTTK